MQEPASLFSLGDWIVGESALAEALGISKPTLRALMRKKALPGLMSLPSGSGMRREAALALRAAWEVEQATARGITHAEAEQQAEQTHQAIITALSRNASELSDVRSLALALDGAIKEMRGMQREMAELREAIRQLTAALK